MKFPTIEAVARELRRHHLYVEGDGTDVRLQVYEDGAWAIRTGLSDYDQDHRGFWGAGWLPKGRMGGRRIARDLLEQAKDAHAQRESFKAAMKAPNGWNDNRP